MVDKSKVAEGSEPVLGSIQYSAFSIDTGEVLICVNAIDGQHDNGKEYVESEIIFALTILPDQKMYVALYSDSAFFYGPVRIYKNHIVTRFVNFYEKELKENFDAKVKEIRDIRMQRKSNLIIPNASGNLITL